MNKSWCALAVLVASLSLQGCASFYSEKEVAAAPLQAQIKKDVKGATALLEIQGGNCYKDEALRQELSKFASDIGLREVPAGPADYHIVARVVRCDDFDTSLRGKGGPVLHYTAFALTVMTVPYFYDEDLQIELTVRKRGKELYKGQQGAQAFVIGGWLITPLMLTNKYGNHNGPMIRNILAKQLAEIEAQGVFQ